MFNTLHFVSVTHVKPVCGTCVSRAHLKPHVDSRHTYSTHTYTYVRSLALIQGMRALGSSPIKGLQTYTGLKDALDRETT